MSSKNLQSLQKALRVLKLFSSWEGDLRASDIAEKLGYHKSSLQRLMSTLIAEGFLEKSPDRPAHYRLGVEALLLGNAAKVNQDIRSAAKPYLIELSNKTQETVHLCVADNFQVYYLDKIDSSQSVRIFTHIGERIPIHCSSMGKCIMAHMDPQELDKGIAANGLDPMTPNTITNRKDLDAELEYIRQHGFAFDNEEWNIGVKCVAAPIFDDTGNSVAGVSCSGPAQRFTGQTMAHIAQQVKETALAISRRLGFHGAVAQ